jgi:hypothetical protein
VDGLNTNLQRMSNFWIRPAGTDLFKNFRLAACKLMGVVRIPSLGTLAVRRNKQAASPCCKVNRGKDVCGRSTSGKARRTRCEQVHSICVRGAICEDYYSSRRLKRAKALKHRWLSLLIQDRNCRCVVQDGALKLCNSEIASENTDSRIDAQYVSQAISQQGVEAAQHGRDGSVFSHALLGPNRLIDELSVSRLQVVAAVATA